MPPVGFEHTFSAGKRPQTYALDRAATGTGDCSLAQNVLSQLPPCVTRAMFALLGGTNDYFAKYRMRPNYETEDQNFPQDTNLQGMRLHKRLRFQQFNEVIFASFNP